MKKTIPILLVILGSLGTSSFAGDKVVIPTAVEKPQYEWSKFALGITYIYQQQDYKLTGATFSTEPAYELYIAGLGPDSVQNLENTADSLVLRFSYTPLPFVTFFAVGGRVDGTVDVSMAPPIGDVSEDYDGWVYGGGVTLAYAHKQYFATLTGSYTFASLEDAEINTLVVSPKIGIFNEKGALWVGAQYQRTEHTQSGNISFNLPPVVPITFTADLEDAHNWNFLAGGSWNFTEDLSLIAEVGFGDRTQYLISLEKKF